MPSPPSSDFISIILFTTLISPTADRTTVQSFNSASLSIANDVDRLTTNFSFLFVSFRYPSAARTSVYSSPRGSPSSFTTAKRSASGSIAKPASAPCFTTISPSNLRFSGNGSVPLANSPFGSQNNSITSQPSESKRTGKAFEPAPFTASITTLNFLFCILFKSIQLILTHEIICFWMAFCSGQTSPESGASSIWIF